MPREFSIAHITGTAEVSKNHLLSDELIFSRERRTLREMFFKPYESKKEFIYCARHTFLPMAMLAVAILYPPLIIAVPVLIGGFSIVCAALGGVNKLCGNERGASFFLDTAECLIKDLFQGLIDLVVLPLSALVMVTRCVSTGLHAAGISGEKEEKFSLPVFK